MELLLVGIAIGAGTLYLAKRGNAAAQSAVGWTARKAGWAVDRARQSIDETTKVAREHYERGQNEARARHAATVENETATENAKHEGR